MVARLFILVFAPPVLILAFVYALLCGIAKAVVFAVLAVHGELDSIKRDWQAGSLKWGDD